MLPNFFLYHLDLLRLPLSPLPLSSLLSIISALIFISLVTFSMFSFPLLSPSLLLTYPLLLFSSFLSILLSFVLSLPPAHHPHFFTLIPSFSPLTFRFPSLTSFTPIDLSLSLSLSCPPLLVPNY